MWEVPLPQRAKLLCCLCTQLGWCPYGPDLISLLLAPLAQNFDHLVAICSILFTPICHNSSGRLVQVKWFILITCIYIYNYYTLLTVPLKVEILPSVGTKIHEASPWHWQSQAPRRRERRHRSFCRSTAPHKTSNMGTVQEMVKPAKTTGNLPVLRFGPSTSQVISLEIFSK